MESKSDVGFWGPMRSDVDIYGPMRSDAVISITAEGTLSPMGISYGKQQPAIHYLQSEINGVCMSVAWRIDGDG